MTFTLIAGKAGYPAVISQAESGGNPDGEGIRIAIVADTKDNILESLVKFTQSGGGFSYDDRSGKYRESKRFQFIIDPQVQPSMMQELNAIKDKIYDWFAAGASPVYFFFTINSQSEKFRLQNGTGVFYFKCKVQVFQWREIGPGLYAEGSMRLIISEF